MKGLSIIFTLILLSSCSSFEMMRYRHIKKVPATPQQFSSGNPKNSVGPEFENSEIIEEPVVAATEVNASDTIQYSATGHSRTIVQTGIPGDTMQAKTKIAREIVPVLPVRKDRSLLIAVLMILAGIGLIVLGIFLISLFQANPVMQVLIALLSLFAAWKLISFGTKIFIARFRKDRTYKED